MHEAVFVKTLAVIAILKNQPPPEVVEGLSIPPAKLLLQPQPHCPAGADQGQSWTQALRPTPCRRRPGQKLDSSSTTIPLQAQARAACFGNARFKLGKNRGMNSAKARPLLNIYPKASVLHVLQSACDSSPTCALFSTPANMEVMDRAHLTAESQSTKPVCLSQCTLRGLPLRTTPRIAGCHHAAPF